MHQAVTLLDLAGCFLAIWNLLNLTEEAGSLFTKQVLRKNTGTT